MRWRWGGGGYVGVGGEEEVGCPRFCLLVPSLARNSVGALPLPRSSRVAPPLSLRIASIVTSQSLLT